MPEDLKLRVLPFFSHLSRKHFCYKNINTFLNCSIYGKRERALYYTNVTVFLHVFINSPYALKLYEQCHTYGLQIILQVAFLKDLLQFFAPYRTPIIQEFPSTLSSAH